VLWQEIYLYTNSENVLCPQVNVGCVPKKVMYNAAVHSEFIHDHSDYGFNVTSNSFNWG